MSLNLTRKLVPRELLSEQLPKAIEFLESSALPPTDFKVIDESPIFLFSAGWRSGSTLLQRLVCSDRSVLMWGEPYGDRIPVPRLAATIADFYNNDPTIKYAMENFAGEMSEEWIANLNPGTKMLRNAHLAYFETLFAKHAQSEKYSRWGAKWVRLSAYYAYYLRWLYPHSKFIFLIRHPLSAYHSYKRKKWFSVRPHFRVNNVFRFMVFWGYLSNSFMKEYRNLNGMLIRYEDLIRDEQVIPKLSEFLNINIKPDVLKNIVGSRDKKKLKISILENVVCQILTSNVYRKLGYQSHP
jgi:hypothetical protein